MADQDFSVLLDDGKPNQISVGLVETPSHRMISYLLDPTKIGDALFCINEQDPDYLPLVGLRTRRLGEVYPYPAIQGYRAGNEVDVVCYMQAEGKELPSPVRVIAYMAPVYGLQVVALLSAATHTMILSPNSVWVVGWNAYGQLGTRDRVQHEFFVDLGDTPYPSAPDFSKVTDGSAGASHSMLIIDGVIWASGRNSYGQLGAGNTTWSNEYINTGFTAQSVSCGLDHSIAIKDGILWVCGRNNNGQLGLGDTYNRLSFTSTGISVLKAVCHIADHTLIIKPDNSVWSCGYGGQGETGLGSDINITHTFTHTSMRASDIATGANHSMLIDLSGGVWTTGHNNGGRLGLGDAINRYRFTATGMSADVIAAGSTHSMLISGGKLYATGNNGNGQLGLGQEVTLVYSFADTGLLANDVVVGFDHTIILNSNGMLATGDNPRGQLGLGDTIRRYIFTQVVQE